MTVAGTTDLASTQGSEKLSVPSHSILDNISHTSAEGSGSGTVLVPDARLLFGGDYKQSGLDLILSKDGRDFTIHDYFKGSHHADLTSPDGARLDGSLIDAMTAGHTQYAQASGAADAAKVIGQVTKLTGSATAIRNGVAVELHAGDNVMKGDVVQAGAGASCVMTFVDGTVFGLSSNARMVLNEMIYDPNGSSNSALMSLVQGTITFVAGETAKHGDMKVDTPVATMGIRGTAILCEIGFEVQLSNAPPVKFQLLVEKGNVAGSALLFSKSDPNTPIDTLDRTAVASFIDGFGNVTHGSSPPLSDVAKQIIKDAFSVYFPGYVPDLDNANPQSHPGSFGSPPWEQPGGGFYPIPQSGPFDQPLKFIIPISAPGTNVQDPALLQVTFTPPPTVSVQISPTKKVTEGGALPLNVTAQSDQNAPTVLISGAPPGVVLDDGHGHKATSDGSTPIDVTGWNLATLSITPTSDHNFTLTVTASDGDVSATATEQVIINPAAPTVTWAAATPGVQGTAIGLGALAASVTSLAGDTNTLNTLTISGAPAGAVLSDGHGHSAISDGSTPIDVVGWNLSTLAITPSGDHNFTLTATATEKDADGDISTPTTATEQVIVKPEAPTVTWAAATPGVEGTAIGLGTLAAAVNSHAGDTDTLNTLTISGAPAGAVLSDGHGHSATSDGSTPIDVAGWNLSTLTITPTGDANFTLTATATEKDADGDISTPATATEQVIVNPVAPTVTTAPVSGIEDGPIALSISASANGDGNTLQSLVISAIPVGAVLSDGHGHSFTATNATTSVDVLGWTLASLTIDTSNAQGGDEANFTLQVTATAKDADGNTSSTTASETVTVTPEAPSISASPATGVEGSPIALHISASGDEAGDTLASLVIGAIPIGDTLSDGHGHSFTASAGHTSVDVHTWNLSTLTITPTTAADFALTVTATVKDFEGDVGPSATATAQVTVGPTAPTVTTAPVSGIEDGPIALSVSASSTGLPGDGNSLQSLVISAIPVGAVLSDGHGHSFTATNATTSVNVLGWTLAGLTIDTSNAQAGDEANFTLQVAAIEKDADGNTSSTIASETVTITPEAPSISASPATGVEGSPIAIHVSASGDEAGDTLASLVIGAIPIGDTLSDGHGHSFTASAGHTSVDVRTWNVSTLTITPTTTVDFTLTVTATVKDFEGDVGPSATKNLPVHVNDPPYVTATAATGSVPTALLTATAAAYLTDSHDLVNGLGGSSGFGSSIGRNDDGSSQSLDVTSVFGSAGLNLFGHTYTHIYVNNNGNITFTGPNGTYTPGQISAGSNPIIAPFWADVDTRGGTDTPSPGGDSTGSNLVYYSLDSTNHVLTVTWDDVGYYNEHTNKVDAFQLQLIGLGNGNFDIVFRYESINWTTGDASGGSNGLGGSIARVGYSAGDGNPAHYFELSGSGNQTSMLNLDSATGNTGIAGVDVFQVISGQVTNAPIASGTISFADPDDNTHTASVQPEAAGYKGSFTLDPISESNGAGSVAWHFSLSTAEMSAISIGTPLVQSYDIAINDGHPGGQTTQTVSVMIGTAGNDTLTADHAIDVMIGGAGNDTFVFSSHIGPQTVVDFQTGADKIDITQVSGVTADNLADWLKGDSGFAAHATQVGSDTVIDLDQTPHGTDTVVLKNIALNNLHASDFIVHPGGGSI